MTAKNFATCLATGLLLLTTATAARAQQDAFCTDGCDYDAQYFSPVEFDFDCLPIRKDCGYFFGYDKLSWAFTGERLGLGTRNTSQASLNPWRVFDQNGQIIANPDPDGDDDFIFLPGLQVNIAPPALVGGINSAPPRAEFAWGERYEFGHFSGNTGWLVGILDGPEAVSAQNYGFGLTGQDETITAAPLGLPSPFPGAPNQLLSPLGSVLIVFDDPLNLMLGFIDLVDGTVGAIPGGSLEGDTNGDGVLDGDGFADDIDRDGQFGPDGFDLDDPGEIPDAFRLGGTPADFGDLVLLPTSWQSISVRNTTEMQGIEMMRTHRLRNGRRMAKNQNNEFEMLYGVRYLRLNDNFLVNGTGGVLGTSFWDTSISNNIVGPQFAMKWRRQQGKMLMNLNSRVLLGYNIQNFEQTAALGEDLIVGQHNHPLYFSPTYSHHGKREDDFSPVIELRAEASYQLTSAIAVKLGYNAVFVDNIKRAAQHVRYELPNLGFRDGGTQDIFINGVSFGFEVVH